MIALLLALAAVQGDPFAAPALPDPDLAAQRGGFRLPNGIDVAMTVQTQTSVNGAIVLRTVFTADQGTPTLTVYAPKPGTTVAAAPSTPAAATGTAGAPTITYDGRNGIQVTPGSAAPGISVAAGAASAGGAVPAGLEQVGATATTDAGTISQQVQGGLRTVALRGSDLSITHIAGDAFGSAIANSGNDRAIDTSTSVSIDLGNAGPDILGSAMLRVQDVAVEAATMRIQ